MKKMLLITMLCVAASSVFAESKLWVKVTSNTVNEVWFDATQGQDKEQKVTRDWINDPAGYFTLVSGTITRKAGEAMTIAEEWYAGYKKVDPGTGVWLKLSQAEKDAVDAANKDQLAEDIARGKGLAALRELINEEIGGGGKEITEQELIDRIKTKL